MGKRFVKLFRIPGGHTYWRDHGTINHDGMVAISDDSGPTPDKTDDGILWLDTEKPIIAGVTWFSIPIIVPNSSAHYKRNGWTFSSTCGTPHEVKMLIEHFNMKVSIDGLELSKVCSNDHSEQPRAHSESEQGYC